MVNTLCWPFLLWVKWDSSLPFSPLHRFILRIKLDNKCNILIFKCKCPSWYNFRYFSSVYTKLARQKKVMQMPLFANIMFLPSGFAFSFSSSGSWFKARKKPWLIILMVLLLGNHKYRGQFYPRNLANHPINRAQICPQMRSHFRRLLGETTVWIVHCAWQANRELWKQSICRTFLILGKLVTRLSDKVVFEGYLDFLR